MNKEYDTLNKIFLFEGLESIQIDNILNSTKYTVKEYRRGELVFSDKFNDRGVGFVLFGECEVKKIRDGRFVILNTLRECDSFGILSVFAPEDEFPTSVFARKNTAVLFFSEEEIQLMLKKNPKIALNIISFLAKRIIFLNNKIATYSGSTVPEKLATYLYSKYKDEGDEFVLNCKRCSEALGVGRASVYRALDALVLEGTIKFDNKTVKIISPEGLERK